MKEEETIEFTATQLACEIAYGVSDHELSIDAVGKRLMDFAHAVLRAAGVKIIEDRMD